MVVDPKILAEYDELTLEEGALEAEIRKIRERRDHLRSIILGVAIITDDKLDKMDTSPTHKKKGRRPLSSWERLRQQPPAALAGTVNIVRELGQATNRQVAEKLGISVAAASLRLSRAFRKRWLNRVSQGVYEIEPLGGVMTMK